MNKPIDAMWQLTKESIHLPPNPDNEEYLAKLRLIYYAGARALYILLLATDEDETEQLYDELHGEFEGLKKQLKVN